MKRCTECRNTNDCKIWNHIKEFYVMEGDEQVRTSQMSLINRHIFPQYGISKNLITVFGDEISKECDNFIIDDFFKTEEKE